MKIKRILAATVVVAVFMGGVAFLVLRDTGQAATNFVVGPGVVRDKTTFVVVGPGVVRDKTTFVVVGPGVVRDKTTGLEWMRCSLGQDWSENTETCEGSVLRYTFEQAQEAARSLNAAGGYKGKADWRVPTKDDLVTLIVCSNGVDGGACAAGSLRPTIAQTVFPRTPDDDYWTSSPVVGNSDGAWSVDFDDGGVGNYGRYNDGYHVRLVRASK